MLYSSSNRKVSQSLDWGLIACFLALVVIGWVNIFAATNATESAGALSFATRSGKQLVWIVISLGVAGLILFLFNPRLWELISIPSYALVMVLLVAVIFVGGEIKGSRSWFTLGPVSFQPAEISKITTSLVLAMLMSRGGFDLRRLRDFLIAAAVIALPMLTIVAEKETGSALVYIGFIFVLYREGLSGWFIGSIGGIIALFIITLTGSSYAALATTLVGVSLCYAIHCDRIGKWVIREGPVLLLLALLPRIWNVLGGEAPGRLLQAVTPIRLILVLMLVMIIVLAIVAYRRKRLSIWVCVLALLTGAAVTMSTRFVFDNILQDHQQKRIEVLLGLRDDPAGVGYNVAQSKIAIGSGGFLGKGFLNGTQTTFGFVPEQSTDFIFCTIGEEWGFLGCLIVIALYLFLIIRIILDSERCREHFTRIYGYCIAGIIFMHMFINIGMTIGLMPVIGIPLPLISYGGSSLLAFTIMIFIFIALDHNERKYF